jgi:5-methylcytosine-specific restriction endonuclease McrA
MIKRLEPAVERNEAKAAHLGIRSDSLPSEPIFRVISDDLYAQCTDWLFVAANIAGGAGASPETLISIRKYRGALAFRLAGILRYRADQELRATAAAERAAKAEQKRAELARKRAEKDANLRAAAAAHFGNTRRHADKHRRRLRDEQVAILSTCPYCAQFLGENAALEHIYPVCKGGLSTADNLVFVCADCNSKKHNKTLREFVREMRMDWSYIESALEKLKKSF